jgi:methylase of polypeptide subunit release factors
MASRAERLTSLDNFWTPPWATRSLCEVVLPHAGVDPSRLTVWEPACGEGHMAAVLAEYFDDVFATDIHDYDGNCNKTYDFLSAETEYYHEHDWIITNPPFSGKQRRGEVRIDRALEFTLLALWRARAGVAMFVRSQWAIEGCQRYESLFRGNPPTVVAFFSERVPLCRGRWNPDGTTATAYTWLVWVKGKKPMPTFWIPPGQRKRLTRPDDRARFAAWSIKESVAEAAE